MNGKFTIQCDDAAVRAAYEAIAGEAPARVRRVCERWGDGEDDVRRYDVYFVDGGGETRVLKKTDARETAVYYLLGTAHCLPAPARFGKHEAKDGVWMLLEYVPGDDLSEMTDALALAAADSLAAIANRFWQEDAAEFAAKKCDDRFERYHARILRRAAFPEDGSALRRAYQLFLDRQETCPRTLCCGDFLPGNAIWDGARVVIVDWGFGGVMPYALDVARFIAHATPGKSTFPFYMTDAHKRLFLDRVYEKLDRRPERAQYERDVRLALLNEYVEFVEADEDENGWYRAHAEALARELLAE